MTKKTSYTSILIGFLTFGLLGFTLYNMFVRLDIILASMMFTSIFVGIGGLLGGFLGYKHPVATELSSFGITSLLIIQFLWDTAYDIQLGFQEPRVISGFIAVGIFLLNTFTGEFKRGTAKKQIRKLLNM